MANYSYLSDGTKLEAVDGGGEGLVYRGPFVYRKSPGGSSLTLESVAFGGGSLAAGKALLRRCHSFLVESVLQELERRW